MYSTRAAFLGLLFFAACATSGNHDRILVDFAGDSPRLRALSVVDGRVLSAATDEPFDLRLDANVHPGRCILTGARRNLALVGTSDAATFATLVQSLAPWHLGALAAMARDAGVVLDDQFADYWSTTEVDALPGQVLAVRSRSDGEGVAALLSVVAVGADGAIEFAVAAAPVAPSGMFLKIYAMQFVAALRAAGMEPGAFAIDDEPGDNGIWRLRVDVQRAGPNANHRQQELVIGLAASARGLVLIDGHSGGNKVSLAATPWLLRAHELAIAAATRESS